MGTVTVVFSSSDGYVMLLGVALCSLFENKKGNYSVSVFVIDGGISEKNKDRLRVLERRYGFTITYVIPDEKLFEEVPTANWPVENYYRIALARLLPRACRKVIWLDADVIVRGNIAELFTIDLTGNIAGAVADHFQDLRRDHLKKLCESVRAFKAPEKPAYFNSGMLLVDLDLWRKHEIEKKLFTFIRENPDKLLFAEQDALNVVLLGYCKSLPARYNLLAEHASAESDPHPLIVHFVGGGKPWYVFSALPYQREYVYYANKTPWKNEKYKKIMDVHFAKKYHIYPLVWRAWIAYKKIKRYFDSSGKTG